MNAILIVVIGVAAMWLLAIVFALALAKASAQADEIAAGWDRDRRWWIEDPDD